MLAETCVFIVSSDSDYGIAVTELKEAGVRVIGIGEAKVSEKYQQSLDRFIKLDESEFDVDDINESDDIGAISYEPLPPWYVGGSDAYRYGATGIGS